MPDPYKSIKVLQSSLVTEEMVCEFSEWVERVDIKVFSRSLRTLAFYHLNAERDQVTEDFRLFLDQLPAVFDFLDVVEDELEK